MNKTIIRKEIYEKRRKLNKIFVETNSKNIFINLCKTKVFDFKNILSLFIEGSYDNGNKKGTTRK